MNSETNWLDDLCECDCCGNTYPVGYLILQDDGDNICEDCYDVIELAIDSEEDLNKQLSNEN